VPTRIPSSTSFIQQQSLLQSLAVSVSKMGKIQLHEHTQSYRAISTKSPHGLKCLKALFSEYDSPDPDATKLYDLFAKDFQDHVNGEDRSVSRDEAIETILASRSRCTKHQIDLKHASCIEHSGTSQTVYFEAIRFVVPVDANTLNWIRVPVSGRLDVRITPNKFSLKDAVAQIVARRRTADNSELVRQGLNPLTLVPVNMGQGPSPLAANANASGNADVNMIQPATTSSTNTSPVIELPAATKVVHTTTAASLGSGSESRSELPPYQSPTHTHSKSTGTPTFTSGSSLDGSKELAS
ncbi:hypothetical protein HRR84_005105, partial [Exophiala dermatitidis]